MAPHRSAAQPVRWWPGDDVSPERRVDDRFHLARLSLGLSQSALAEAAGVTRQAISGIESGRWFPSLEVALSLAGVLGSSVEDLFGPAVQLPVVTARLAEPVQPGAGPAASSRLVLSEQGERLCAFVLAGDHVMSPGFQPALAVAVGSVSSEELRAQRLAAPGPVLSVAGCDPALPLLAGPLARHRPPVGLAWRSCGNSAALALLRSRAVHAAAIHRRAEDDAPSRSTGTEAVGFAAWREGLVVAPRHREQVTSLRDAIDAGLRIANREPGSEARRLLDDELARLRCDGRDLAGYDTSCSAHLLVASAVAAGLADFGVASEPAAMAYGLGFVAWQTERCELHLATESLRTSEVKALLHVLAGDELPSQIAAISGYDASPCGRLAT